MAIGLPRLLRTSPKLSFICAVLAGTTLTSTAWSLYRRPRVWSPHEVPIAFWAWRNEAPAETDLLDCAQKAQARTLFLRAGQIDLQEGTLRRIRPVQGAIPTGIQLHLVYNATRPLLTKL